MIEWMLRALIASALVACGASVLDRAFRLVGEPRRWIWATAMSVSVLLPVIGHWLPTSPWANEILGRLSAAGIIGGEGSPAQNLADVGAQEAVGAVGWAGSVLLWFVALGWPVASATMAGLFLWSYRRVLSEAVRWREEVVDGFPVLVSHAVGPAIIGIARPRIVIPEWVLQLPTQERRLTMQHEAEHACSGDSRLLAGTGLLLVLMPWNLLLWWQHMRLRLAVETDCDARVLASGANRWEYGRFLLDAASRRSTLPALGPALTMPTSLLERRITEMTDKRPRHPGMRALLLVPIVIFAVASACDVTAPSSPQTDTPATDTPAEQSNQPESGTEPQVAESSQEPLIFVDGVITTIGVEGLSPGDIERIEVIKGAAAAGLYGDRGAHGVIHVFTRSASSEVGRIRATPEESAYDPGRLMPSDVELRVTADSIRLEPRRRDQ